MQNYVLYNDHHFCPRLPHVESYHAFTSAPLSCPTRKTACQLLFFYVRTHVHARPPPCRSGTTRRYRSHAPSSPRRTRGAQPSLAMGEDDERTRPATCRAVSRRCPTCGVSYRTESASCLSGHLRRASGGRIHENMRVCATITHMLAILAPKRYHHPPAPTSDESLTAGADAFSAARTRGPYGGGTENVVSSLFVSYGQMAANQLRIIERSSGKDGQTVRRPTREGAGRKEVEEDKNDGMLLTSDSASERAITAARPWSPPSNPAPCPPGIRALARRA